VLANGAYAPSRSDGRCSANGTVKPIACCCRARFMPKIGLRAVRSSTERPAVGSIQSASASSKSAICATPAVARAKRNFKHCQFGGSMIWSTSARRGFTTIFNTAWYEFPRVVPAALTTREGGQPRGRGSFHPDDRTRQLGSGAATAASAPAKN